MYKLTKGTLSRMRATEQGARELLAQGYELTEGELSEKSEEDELREELVSLGMPKSVASRIKKKETLLEKIDEMKEEE